jgi:hypothetical protein
VTDAFECGGCGHGLLLAVPKLFTWFDPISERQEEVGLCAACAQTFNQYLADQARVYANYLADPPGGV